MTDGLSTLYQDLLGASYDCVDRIVLNAYFRRGHIGPPQFERSFSGCSAVETSLTSPIRPAVSRFLPHK